MDNLSLDNIFARNCEVRRITRPEAYAFLDEHHRLGSTTCRYCYGLFVKRHTGLFERMLDGGTLVAVAGFSGARRWIKGERKISSYEWVRYASLPDIRVVGGMGKVLDAFISEVHPDDVMTYADVTWSNGDAYKALGFADEGITEKPGFTCRKFRLKLSSWQ